MLRDDEVDSVLRRRATTPPETKPNEARSSLTLRNWLRLLAIGVLAFIALGSWAISSPVGSSPDEGFHLSSIYCAATAPASLCPKAVGENSYLLPSDIADAGSCFRFNPSKPAACVRTKWTTLKVRQTAASVNKSSTYPGGFYWVMGAFATTNLAGTVYGIRAIDVLLCVVAAIAVLAIAPPNLRQAGGIGFLLAGGPLGWFLIASVNPSSWAFVSVGFYWIALLTYVAAKSNVVKYMALGLALALAVIGSIARSDVGGYIVIANLAVAAVVLLDRRNASRKRAFIGVLVLTSAIGLVTVLTTSETTGFTNAKGVQHIGHGIGAWVFNAMYIPQITFGAIGYSPLGWLDTNLPFIVPLSATIAIAVLVAHALRRCPRNILMTWICLVVLAIAIPMIMLYRSDAGANTFFVQPRYMLPLLPMLIGLPFIRRDAFCVTRFAAPYRWLFGAAVSLVFSVSLFWNTQRYVHGIHGTAPNLNLSTGARWWSNGLLSPTWNWVIGSGAFVAVVFLSISLLMPPGQSTAVQVPALEES